jgi:hypothetical protein
MFYRRVGANEFAPTVPTGPSGNAQSGCFIPEITLSNQIHIDRISIHTRAIAASTARYWLWAPVLVTTMLLAVLLFASTPSVI